MPFFSGWFGQTLIAGFRRFSDAFNRTTSGILENNWRTFRGSWFANGSAAQSDDAASGYPLAAIPIGSPNATTSVTNLTNGVGPAFWVTDSNNWWGAFGHSTQTTSTNCGGGPSGCGSPTIPSCSCGSAQACGSDCGGAGGSCTTGTPSCGGCPTESCTICQSNTGSWSTNYPSSCPCGGGVDSRTSYVLIPNNVGSCVENGYTAQVNCTNCGGCPTNTICCSFPEYRCTFTQVSGTRCVSTARTLYNCSATSQTVTTTNFFLRVVNSVGGTVSTATGDVSLASAASAIRVFTSNNTATATAFSDNAMTNQTGSITVTPTSPNRGIFTGIVKGPSSFNQGSTGDNFNSSI